MVLTEDMCQTKAYHSTVWAVYCWRLTPMITRYVEKNNVISYSYKKKTSIQQLVLDCVYRILQYIRISCRMAIPACFGLWPFRFVAVSVCGRFGLWPFRFVDFSVCGRFGLWPFWCVALLVCGLSVVAVSVCGCYDVLPYKKTHNKNPNVAVAEPIVPLISNYMSITQTEILAVLAEFVIAVSLQITNCEVLLADWI